jgi:hypothetical protein
MPPALSIPGESMHKPDEDPGPQMGHDLPARYQRSLRTGTYLHAYCPVCGANLIEEDWIVFEIKVGDQAGILRLSPRFNVFDKESTIELQNETELDDLCCHRCHASLINPRVRCGRCQAKTARIKISAVQLDIHLNICGRLGCPWHGLSERDKARLILEE